MAFQKTAKCNSPNRVVFKARVPFQVQLERLGEPLEGRPYVIEAADGQRYEGELDAEGKTAEVNLVEGEVRVRILPPRAAGGEPAV